MTDEMLEMLIGKHIDGEITPAEQRMLKAALERDSGARELFEQLRDLHKSTRQVVAAEIGKREKTAEEIFERAWQRQTGRPARRLIELGGYWRFAAGLAAGLIIGLALHFVLMRDSATQDKPEPPVTNARTRLGMFSSLREAPICARMKCLSASAKRNWYDRILPLMASA